MATGGVPCDRRPREDTWNIRPSGFYFGKAWIQNGCQQANLPYNQSVLMIFGKCLKNRHLIFIGDSNLRSFARIFINDLKLTMTRGRVENFSELIYAVNSQMNVSLLYVPHNLPYITAPFINKDLFVPITRRFDDIQAGSNSVIVVHLWLHSKMMDTRVFRRHVRQIRISAERMLQRAPHVELVIKGPHACKGHRPPTDYAVLEHRRIWWEEFQGIHDKVIFLDMWDMTVGNENQDMHPPCVMDMIYTLLTHLCHI